jgi:dienelactone hydrolase
MTRISTKLLSAFLVVAVFGCQAFGAENSPGPQGPEEGVIRRQSWLIPAQDRMTMMRTTVFRPPGPGPFPLAVINHGSTQNELRRAAYRLPEFPALTEWLVARGYAVAVLQRPGHGATRGPYYGDQGGYANADYRKAGLYAAASILAAIDFMSYQPFVRKTGAVAIGQSAGGWGVIALSTLYSRPLSGVIAVAAGRGGRIDDVAGKNCAPQRLLDSARWSGEKARVPSLWIYAENDSYFPPAVSKGLFDAFRRGGGHAEYKLLPPVGTEGHDAIDAREAVPLWGSAVERFLKSLR